MTEWIKAPYPINTARAIVKNEYGDSKNLSDKIIQYGMIHSSSIDKIAYELSSGEGMDQKPMYAVSVVYYDRANQQTKRIHNLFETFTSELAALKYIKDLIVQCRNNPVGWFRCPKCELLRFRFVAWNPKTEEWYPGIPRCSACVGHDDYLPLLSPTSADTA